MLKRRQFLVSAAAVLAAPAVLGKARAAGAEVTLKLHHFLGPKSPAQVKMLQPWVQAIQDESRGRIKIDIYPSMSLGGSPPQLFRQVADGIVDIVWTVNGYTPGLFPRSEAFELPTVFTNDIVATNLAMRAMFDEYLAEEYKAVHVLFNHVHAGQGIHMAEAPVHTPDDTKGKKLRVPGPTGNAVVEALGATPVTMPVPDLPQALTTHVVDGALVPWEIIPALQLQESTKYQIEGPDNNRFGNTTFQVSMNKARWEGLPEDLKEAFDKHCGEDWLREVARIWREDDDEGIKMAVDSGNEHIVLTQEQMDAFNKVLAPVVDKWTAAHANAGFDAKALVEAARKTIAAKKA